MSTATTLRADLEAIDTRLKNIAEREVAIPVEFASKRKPALVTELQSIRVEREMLASQRDQVFADLQQADDVARHEAHGLIQLRTNDHPGISGATPLAVINGATPLFAGDIFEWPVDTPVPPWATRI